MPDSGERSICVIAWRGCSEERNRSATVITADRGWIKGAGSGLGKDRVLQIEISADDLITLREWLDSNPEVPVGDWFKTFENFSICGRGELIKTLLSRKQSALGEELF